MNGREKLISVSARGYRIEGGCAVSPDGNILALNMDKMGYCRFGVSFSGKVKSVYVHRLLAFQKYGEALFEPGMEVRHKNNIATDNSDDNILIGTRHQNAMDRRPEVRLRMAKNAARVLRSLSEDQVRQLREDREAGAKYSDLMEKYGVCKSTVSNVVNMKVYKDV